MLLTSSRRILLAAIAILLSFSLVEAHSRRPNPLKRIAYASDASIDIVKRDTSLSRRGSQLLSSDSLRLTLRAFDQTFHLHLEPNDEVVHPSGATVNVWQWDEASQQEVLTERRTIPREEVRAYHGVVVHPAHTARRLYEDREGVSRWQSGIDEEEGVMGRAAIMVHDAEGPSPRFEGLFDWRGNQHTVQTARNYHAGRHDLDPQVHKRSVDLDHIVVHRDSDILSDLEAEQLGSRDVVSAAASVACSHDAHDFNANNHLFLTGSNDDEFSRSPLEFFARPPSIGRRSWWERDASSSSSLLSPLLARNLSSDFIYDPDPLTLTRRQDALGNGSNNSYVSSIGNTQGCPKSAMVVYVGIAGDCSFTAANGGSVSNTSSTLLTVMNSVSQTYRNTFNVSLGVVELDVRQGSCPSSSSSSGGNAPWNVACSAMSIDDRLSAFSSWRASQPSNGTGLWHLLTGCASSGSNVGEIGVAWLGTLCKTDSSSSGGDTVSGTGVTANTNRNAQVVAHEMGHNFGAIHDCMSGCSLTGSKALQSNGATCCPQSGSSCNDADAHIMSPVAAQNTMKFSPCSVGNVCSMLGGGGLDTDCVVKPGNRETLSTQQCGNGILEPGGEECDAGPNGSRCCSTDCKLTSGSVCDPSSSACCTSSCQFASSSQLCRAAKDSSGCDTPEYCTGSSADCPADSYKDNGSSCTLSNVSNLQCANGVCTSRDKQCQSQSSSTSGSTFSKACSVRADQSCSLACQDEGSSSTCTVFQTNFVDGTSCGYGGHCQSGKCKSDGWQSTFRGWYANNLNIAIPVTIVVAIIVLLILWALVRCCFGGGRRGSRRGAKPVAGGGAAGFVPWSRRGGRTSMAAAGPQPPPPPMRTSGAGAGPYGYQNVASTDYPSYAPPPGAPPPMGAPPPVPPRASRGQHNGWVDATQWNGR